MIVANQDIYRKFGEANRRSYEKKYNENYYDDWYSIFKITTSEESTMPQRLRKVYSAANNLLYMEYGNMELDKSIDFIFPDKNSNNIVYIYCKTEYIHKLINAIIGITDINTTGKCDIVYISEINATRNFVAPTCNMTNNSNPDDYLYANKIKSNILKPTPDTLNIVISEKYIKGILEMCRNDSKLRDSIIIDTALDGFRVVKCKNMKSFEKIHDYINNK